MDRVEPRMTRIFTDGERVDHIAKHFEVCACDTTINQPGNEPHYPCQLTQRDSRFARGSTHFNLRSQLGEGNLWFSLCGLELIHE